MILSVNILFLFAFLLSLLNLGIGLLVVFEEIFLQEMLCGWGVSFGNHVTHRRFLGSGQSNEFTRQLVLNGMRVGIFFFIAVFLLYFGYFNTAPFVYSLFGTYFIFLGYLIIDFYQTSVRKIR